MLKRDAEEVENGVYCDDKEMIVCITLNTKRNGHMSPLPSLPASLPSSSSCMTIGCHAERRQIRAQARRAQEGEQRRAREDEIRATRASRSGAPGTYVDRTPIIIKPKREGGSGVFSYASNDRGKSVVGHTQSHSARYSGGPRETRSDTCSWFGRETRAGATRLASLELTERTKQERMRETGARWGHVERDRVPAPRLEYTVTAGTGTRDPPPRSRAWGADAHTVVVARRSGARRCVPEEERTERDDYGDVHEVYEARLASIERRLARGRGHDTGVQYVGHGDSSHHAKKVDSSLRHGSGNGGNPGAARERDSSHGIRSTSSSSVELEGSSSMHMGPIAQTMADFRAGKFQPS